ncbi:hypothetical protein IWQ60_000908 [Tieghemiomyces parasiticus]|uniref:Uncharacterized protein n=1 Tax=Tieghemiomyces parasiticus TaxID=78921 RepID=A0A9W8AF09_9FUNG|nr:hypothetical protein IWQ60_000908 [Tieghemiomyces parasiticus]
MSFPKPQGSGLLKSPAASWRLRRQTITALSSSTHRTYHRLAPSPAPAPPTCVSRARALTLTSATSPASLPVTTRSHYHTLRSHYESWDAEDSPVVASPLPGSPFTAAATAVPPPSQYYVSRSDASAANGNQAGSQDEPAASTEDYCTLQGLTSNAVNLSLGSAIFVQQMLFGEPSAASSSSSSSSLSAENKGVSVTRLGSVSAPYPAAPKGDEGAAGETNDALEAALRRVF